MFQVLQSKVVDLITVHVVMNRTNLLDRLFYLFDVVSHLLNFLKRGIFVAEHRIVKGGRFDRFWAQGHSPKQTA